MRFAARTPLIATFALLMLTAGAVSGCEEEGPLEKAGAAADEAVKDSKRAIEDAAD